MKRTIFFAFALFIASAASLKAQVAIGTTETPRATLDVVAAKTDGTTAEGIIAPRLTLAQLKSADGQYLAPQDGAIVYVTNIAGGTTTKTAAITAPGYYYFDGTALEWKALGGGGSGSGWTTDVIIQNLTTNYNPAASVFSAYETVILGVGSSANTVTLPNLTLTDKGKRVYVVNNVNGGNAPVNFTPPNETDGSPAAERTYPVTNKTTQGFYWTGTVWVVMGK
jgi:hypothetical protein